VVDSHAQASAIAITKPVTGTAARALPRNVNWKRAPVVV
jgi:hypothetical protein